MAVSSHGADGAGGESLLQHREYVVRLCRLLLRDPADAEDAAQQVFLHAFRALRNGVEPLNPRAWLAQIARNECLSSIRTATAKGAVPVPEAFVVDEVDPAALAAQRALVERLQEELADLPERQREALLLREFLGLSYDEVAAEMAASQPAVESLLLRARRRLAGRLDGVRRSSLALAFWRLLPGDGAAESVATGSVATGGAAFAVAKIAAVGAVAVTVGGATMEMDRSAQRQPARVLAKPAAVVQRAVVRPVARSARPVPVVQKTAVTEQENEHRGGSPGPSGDPPVPEVTPEASSSGPGPSSSSGEPETTTVRVDNSGPGSVSSGSLDNSGPGSVSSGSSDSGSGDSGSSTSSGHDGSESGGSHD